MHAPGDRGGTTVLQSNAASTDALFLSGLLLCLACQPPARQPHEPEPSMTRNTDSPSREADERSSPKKVPPRLEPTRRELTVGRRADAPAGSARPRAKGIAVASIGTAALGATAAWVA